LTGAPPAEVRIQFHAPTIPHRQGRRPE
jgi:hypothetical protein